VFTRSGPIPLSGSDTSRHLSARTDQGDQPVEHDRQLKGVIKQANAILDEEANQACRALTERASIPFNPLPRLTSLARLLQIAGYPARACHSKMPREAVAGIDALFSDAPDDE
jgi:hypothetical protein